MTLARQAAELQERQGPMMAEDGRGNSRTRDATAACDNRTIFHATFHRQHGGQSSWSASGKDGRTDRQQWRKGSAEGSRGQPCLSHDGYALFQPSSPAITLSSNHKKQKQKQKEQKEDEQAANE